MNILGNDSDTRRLLHVFWILIKLFLGLIVKESKSMVPPRAFISIHAV